MNIPEQIQTMNKFMNRRDFVKPDWYQKPNGAMYHALTYVNHIIGCLQSETALQAEAIAVFCSRAYNLLKSPEAEEINDDYKLLAINYVYTVDSWLRGAHPQAFEQIDPFTIPELTDGEKARVRRFIPGI